MSFEIESDSGAPLDLFSINPTKPAFGFKDLCSVRCTFGAPFFAYSEGGLRYAVVQGCCNHWECPRCGQMVAAKHYGRIVEGARAIAKDHDLYFITITCRGGDLSEKEATDHYLAWSSKFLDTCYTKAKRTGQDWYYVQVTEKQKRGAPHSHILSTFHPHDLVEGIKESWKRDASGKLVVSYDDALRSEWIQEMVQRAGLGEQYDISKVRTVEGAARYVAKYMFKKAQFEAHYPKHWHRVRYSQSWPKLAQKKTDAFVLLSADDWHLLAQKAAVVDAQVGDAYESACYFLHGSDTLIHERKA